MTDPIVRCPEHGVTAGRCSACDREGERVLSGERRRRLSTFLSGALRHFPGEVGLSLDRRGWTDRDALVAAASRRYGWATPERVAAVIETDPKGRFERRGDDVRAAYGHSVDVDLETGGTDVPDVLYHGTAPANRPAIEREGLRPMDRQAVHLSESPAEARAVGERHADEPVVFVVDAAGLVEAGHAVTARGRSTYTVDRVPPEFLAPADPEV